MNSAENFENLAKAFYNAGGTAKNFEEAISKAEKAADNTAQKRQNVNSFMKDVQKKSTANKKAAETKSLSSVLGSAMDRGALEVTFEGKTYYRARKNSKTWRVR